MADLGAILSEAVESGDAPFLVAMTGNSGGVTWSGQAGDRVPGTPASEDTVFRIFSMTKAIGSLAAMILIDRGKLGLETPVAEVIPAFADIKVLDGFDSDGKPNLRAPKTTATIRNLATHTTGFVYEFWNADMPRYMEATEHPTIISGLKASLMGPLVFDPGARWDYGQGIDWLGQAVEAVDGRRIDQFCKEEIFDPLGMSDTRFELEGTMADRLANVSARDETGAFVETDLAPPPNPEFYGMGHALYSTAPDYMRFLRMMLNRGSLDGATILSPGGVDTMIANQIGDLRLGVMQTVAPPVTGDVDMFPGCDKTHSFGFMRMEVDVPGMRSAGAQAWAGVLNSHYWFDPARDVAGLIMTQLLPFVDERFMGVYERFEKGVYENLGAPQKAA